MTQIYFSDKQLRMNQTHRERYMADRGLTSEQAEKVQLIEHVKFWQVQAAALAVKADSLERGLKCNTEAEIPCIVCSGKIRYRMLSEGDTSAMCSTQNCVRWGMTPEILKAMAAMRDILAGPSSVQ